MVKPKPQKINYGLKHDPQEDDPILGPIIQQIAKEADMRVREKHDLNGDENLMGLCHEIWKEQEEILKELCIYWKSPGKMNPNVIFD